MRFIEFTLKEGFFQKTVKFSEIANIIYRRIPQGRQRF